jgi:hypothetical protein
VKRHKKTKRPQTPHYWTKFERGVIPPTEIALAQETWGLSETEAQEMAAGEHWINNRYQVHKRVYEYEDGRPSVIWLSIKRRDRQPIHDWRALQRIKNELVGPECEAIELYPAESRLVDTSSQYHLFVVADPTFRFPFGFHERLVVANPGGKARQRPFPPDYPGIIT